MVVIRVILEISNKGGLHLNDWTEVAVRKIKHNEFHCRMIAYNKPVAYNKKNLYSGLWYQNKRFNRETLPAW